MSSTSVAETETNVASESERGALLLDSLEIKGYRCFEHLVVEKLGRVNLIVGKNSVGKTALLEALGAYAHRGYHRILLELLYGREEMPLFFDENKQLMFPKDCVSGFSNLFIGYPQLNFDSNVSLSIGSFLSKRNKLKIYTIRTPNEGLVLVCELLRGDEMVLQTERFSFDDGRISFDTKMPPPMESRFINSGGVPNPILAALWDEIQLTEGQTKAVQALQIINSSIENVGFVAFPKDGKERIPVAVAKNLPQRKPLRSFGEGMHRLLGIALSLANCQNGFLFIDEIENGLHYSIQPNVWRMIFQTARELNVQVFATTHSADCVRAFQQAAEEDEQDEGILIRLVRQNERIKALVFDEEALGTVVEDNIEVR